MALTENPHYVKAIERNVSTKICSPDNRKRRRPGMGSLRSLICSLLVLSMTTPCTSFAADHIQVTKELLLESGLPAQPHAIARTFEGGYIIAGKLGVEAWATRIAANGTVQWRHIVPTGSSAPGFPTQQYAGVAMLKDDSSILCGYKKIDSGAGQDLVGIITHIDKSGRVISEREVYPNGDKSYSITYLRGCVTSVNGAQISGDTMRFDKSGQSSRFDYFIAIGEDGKIVSEKLLDPTPFPKTSTEDVLRASELHFEHAAAIGVIAKAEKIETKKAFYLPDHSVALFGYHYIGGNAFTASTTWVSADIASSQTFVFEPINASIWVTDVVATGNPWEFATVRPVLPVQHLIGPDEKRMGAALAFVRFK